jgi:hypothetical protein
MICITKEQIFNDFALLIEITDEQLGLIEGHPEYIKGNSALMVQMVNAKGNNAHILQLTLNSLVFIRQHMERLLLRYDSVSWVRDGKFFIKRKDYAFDMGKASIIAS